MDRLQKARRAAVSLLNARMYTCREIYVRLCRKGYESELSEQVVSELTEQGWLDDRRFAEMYIEDAVRLGAKGMYRIRQELRQKGVALSIIDAAAEAAEADTEEGLREYLRLRDPEAAVHSRKDLEKLKMRLVRRGYSLGEINRCLEEYSFRFEESPE